MVLKMLVTSQIVFLYSVISFAGFECTNTDGEKLIIGGSSGGCAVFLDIEGEAYQTPRGSFEDSKCKEESINGTYTYISDLENPKDKDKKWTVEIALMRSSQNILMEVVSLSVNNKFIVYPNAKFICDETASLE